MFCKGALRNSLLWIASLSILASAPTALAQTGQPAIINAVDYGMKCDGTTDDFAAWSAAYAAAAASNGATILLPRGTCYIGSNTIAITASNIVVMGAGREATTVAGTGSTIVRIGGTNTARYVTLRDLEVRRIGANPATNTVCIDWSNFNYGTERDTNAQNCGIIRRATYSGSAGGAVSIGLTLDNIAAWNATAAMLELGDVADVYMLVPYLGRNGGELYTTPCMVTITGQANGNSVIGGTLIPQGPNAANASDIFCFNGSLNPGNELWLSNVNAENYRAFIKSDAATPQIGGLRITGGRFAGNPSADFFALSSATKLRALNVTGGTTGGSFTIPRSAGISIGSISGFAIGGNLSLDGGCAPGGGTPTVQGGFLNCVGGSNTASDLTVEGGYVDGTTAIAGSWQKLRVQTRLNGAWSDSSNCNYNSYCKNFSLRGSFTPAIAVAGSSCAQAVLSAAGGDFAIEGDLFTADVTFQVSTPSTCPGTAMITGFPFKMKNSFGGGVVANYNGMAFIDGPLYFAPLGGTSAVLAMKGDMTGASGATPLFAPNFPAGSTLTTRITGTIQ